MHTKLESVCSRRRSVGQHCAHGMRQLSPSDRGDSPQRTAPRQQYLVVQHPRQELRLFSRMDHQSEPWRRLSDRCRQPPLVASHRRRWRLPFRRHSRPESHRRLQFQKTYLFACLINNLFKNKIWQNKLFNFIVKFALSFY